MNLINTMERIDTHTHTWMSRHGIGTVDEVVRAALAQCMTTVALTEHLPLPQEVDDGTFAMEPSRMEEYLADIEQARLMYRDIEIITGIEIDWRFGAEEYLLDWVERYPFELLLGSVHMLSYADGSHWEFDHPGYAEGWNERGEQEVWEEYLELWLQAIRSKVPFDVMTHPDLPKKLDHKPNFDPTGFYTVMTDAAAEAGVMIEVNTSGLYTPVKELYPAPELLKMFCEKGVPCTISSDAHDPKNVGRGFKAACEALKAAGYTQVTVPKRNGDRRTIPLD